MGVAQGMMGATQPANAGSCRSMETQASVQEMMQLSKLQGTWTYTRTAKEAPVKVTIEGDVVTWPQGQKAKITCGVNKIWLQFGGDSDSKTYFAEWGHDGALYWSDNAVWTRVALTPLKTGKFESVIQ